MTKRFTIASSIRNGYAAMGNSMARPKYPNPKGRSIAESIAREKRIAANMLKAGKKKS